MQEFVLIFRTSKDPHANPSPEQIQARMNWMNTVTDQNKLADKGNRLATGNAKTVRPGNIVTDGPCKDTEEFISGYMVVRTATIDEAIELAKTNPILRGGGNIEVRTVL
ncbi:MAG: transcription initiation protein [Chitinophagaceae bacterium]|nr:transcription initiation protein [Chitinophagaceae bacterium]